MRLEEPTLAKLESSAPDDQVPVEDNFCKYCGCRELVLLVRVNKNKSLSRKQERDF